MASLTNYLTLKTPRTMTTKILNKPITISEVKSIIKQLKNRKSHGDDLVINEMLKFGVNILVPALTKLFNLVLESGIFPCDWNTSFQVPLYKKGDPLKCDNYQVEADRRLTYVL